MSNRDDGGPAFPVTDESYKAPYGCAGMSLRDWFAGHAMAGLIAAAETNAETWEEYAADAYQQADAMLEARKK